MGALLILKTHPSATHYDVAT